MKKPSLKIRYVFKNYVLKDLLAWLHLHCPVELALIWTLEVIKGKETNRLVPRRLPVNPLLPKNVCAQLYS